MTPPATTPMKRRTLTRMAAVQAMCHWSQYETHFIDAADLFVSGAFGGEQLVPQGRQIDVPFFRNLINETCTHASELDVLINQALPPEWPLGRIDPVIHAIFRLGASELLYSPDLDTPVIISEYLDVCHGFYESIEVSFVNAVLDKLAKLIREPQA